MIIEVTGWEKIFPEHISEKNLLSEIYKTLKTPPLEKNTIVTWAKMWTDILSKKSFRWQIRIWKDVLYIYIIKELKIKRTVRYHYITIGKIQILKTTNDLRNLEQWETWFVAGRKAKHYSHFEDSLAVSYKVNSFTIWFSNRVKIYVATKVM